MVVNRYYIFLLFLFATLMAADPKVRVNVDENKIYDGESITLTVSVEDGTGFPSVDLSKLTEFKVISGPTQKSNTQWSNGITTSTRSISYVLIPLKKGELSIPKLAIDAEGKKYQSNPISITVYERNEQIPGSQGSGSKTRQFYLEATVDNLNPFRGQQITVTYTLYTIVDISGFDISKEPRYQGFWTNDLYTPRNLQVHAVQLNGEKWYAATVKKTALFPTVSGLLDIEQMTAKVGITVKDNSQRSFFSNMFNSTKNYTISSNKLELDVRPLPDNAGTISAAVGNWSLKAELSSADVQQDEAVTFTIRVKGSGNLQAVNIQEIEFPPSLEIFDPKITVNSQTSRDKIAGEKIIEYVLIPRTPGQFEIPAVNLTYFDPKMEKWRTRKTRPFPLNVTPSARNTATGIGLTKTEISLMGKDIKFSDQNKPMWRRSDEGIYTFWIYIIIGFSGLFYVTPYFLLLSKKHLIANEGSRRAKNALKNSLKILSEPETSSEGTYLAIQKAMNSFLDEKDDRTLERSTSEIISRIQTQKINEDLIKGITTTLNRGDAVRFAPVSTADSIADLEKFREFLANVDQDWTMAK
ncbi:MAG: protein BatD [Candidatus Marinimicrobia bacterium]|nr:protein BatD [Candidatus Neomarinimicrobiota bacterium]MBT3759701.1 protein BatD [Candidatus Neomarinimicrobiota bacterium]MBT3895893.1 protein BatD [Candidatus Neomarinimicrobiota bacterium]MBT4173108.1 protein BatD [Candidatus Neomarinimicrobiota bacterium]MBT4851906.1 protein BatD [Candidatus Neomarinimicrobiota bacterium]